MRRIERETGVRRETVGAYLKAAGIAVRPPRSWGWLPAKPASEVTTDSEAGKTPFPESGPRSLPAKPANEVTTGSGSACKPYQEAIELALSKGRNAMSIWQELVDQYGFASGYQSVKRFVRRLRGPHTTEACAVIVTAPGEECQVDYGSGPMVRHPLSGKYRRTRLFVLTLAYSRKAVRLLVFRSNARVWAELHEKAFRRLGGATRVVVLDNLGEGVLKPDLYDPALNPLYRDLLAHYGAVALPCRVGDPDRKGKVESSVGYAKKTPLKGRRFESLEEAQAFLGPTE